MEAKAALCRDSLAAPRITEVRLRDIAGGLFPFGCRERQVIVLKLYLDDSKRDNVFTVGGFIAPIEMWTDRFEPEWSLALRLAKVPAFHATDFFSFRGDFKGWDKDLPKHTKFAKRFAAIADNHTSACMARGIGLDGHAELVRNHPALIAHAPHGRVTPTMWCTRTCLEWVTTTWKQRPPHEAIAVILEEGDGVGEVIEYLHRLKKQAAPWMPPFVSFATGTKALLPLQAADYLVHEARRRISAVHFPEGPDIRKIRKSFKRLIESDGVSIKYWTRENLATGLASYEGS